MGIDVIHCNNIDTASILIKPGTLNIKYGPNGTGKSTLAKAIELAVRGDDLAPLLPFKYRGKDAAATPKPQVSGLQHITSVFVFNEDYVNHAPITEYNLLSFFSDLQQIVLESPHFQVPAA